MSRPDIIMLDEPTNHLDMESIAWLETYLINYPGAVIIVATTGISGPGGDKDHRAGRRTCHSFPGQLHRLQREAGHAAGGKDESLAEPAAGNPPQEEVIAKLKSFNREKSIKRAESREKMLEKIERVEKPAEINDEMTIRLEPNVVSGNDVLTVRGLSKSFGSQLLFQDVDFDIKRGNGWPSSETTAREKPPF